MQFLLWTSFYFMHVNQQERVGMVSTNNMYRTYSRKDLQTLLVETIAHHVFDLEEKVGNAQN